MNMDIIAEDNSDIVVIKAVTLSLLAPHRIGFKRFVGKGCGRVRSKCRAWAENLVRQGCLWVTVVHDLDKRNECELRQELELVIAGARSRASVVLLPKQEIEAWLLYDAAAIAMAFNESKHPKLRHNPESLDDPKGYLGDIVWKHYRKDYINTDHNEAIAKYVDVSLLKRSPSFAP